MDDTDLTLRNVTYRAFVVRGRAPTAAEVAADAGLTTKDVAAGWRRLHDAHALVLDPVGERIRMANPFSAVPTAFRVRAAGRNWYANCGWDAFGIGAALHADSTIEATCGDCGEALPITVRDGRPDRDDLVFHVLVPASRWWADIGHT